MTMQTNFIFDWDIVAALDPDYKQHLTKNTFIQENTPDQFNKSFTKAEQQIVNEVNFNQPQNQLYHKQICGKTPYQLKPQNQLKPQTRSNHKMKLLAPPKRVLDSGSIFKSGLNTEYHVLQSPYKEATLVVRYHTIEDEGYIKTYKSEFHSFWRRNIFSQDRKRWLAIVFNKKTKFISLLSKHKQKVIISRLGYRLRYFDVHLLSEFYKKLKSYERKTNNNFFLEATNQNPIFNIISLNIQQKTNQRMEWVTGPFLAALQPLLSPQAELWEREPANIRKLTSKLRKYPDIEQMLNIVLGKYQNQHIIKTYKTISKYGGSLPIGILINMFFIQNNLSIIKKIKHWYIDVLNKSDNNLKISNLSKILKIYDTITQSAHKLTNQQLDLYLTFHRKFLQNQNNQVIPVYWWEDVYNMANRYNIRVRLNKLSTNKKINEFHNKLVSIQNRDRKLLKDRTQFKKFQAPTQKYGEFEFTQLENGAELSEEGRAMHHCVGGYVDICKRGDRIIFSMHKKKIKYATISLNGDKYNIPIEEKLSIYNASITNPKILEPISKWHKDVVTEHKNDKQTYREFSQNNMEEIE